MNSLNEKHFESLLKQAYPRLKYIKQHSITYQSKLLKFDFYIPSLNLYIEIQGDQHYNYNSFFHNDVLDFKKQKRRDSLKSEWCDLNGYTLLILTQSETLNMNKEELKLKLKEINL